MQKIIDFINANARARVGGVLLNPAIPLEPDPPYIRLGCDR